MRKFLLFLGLIVSTVSADQTQVYNAQAGAGTVQQPIDTQQVAAQQVQVSNLYSPSTTANNTQTNNQSVTNTSITSTPLNTNKFFENYPYKGTRFSLSVYKMDGTSVLRKTQLDSSNLKKTVIVFFGDWCPACSQFIPQFAQNINALVAAGVKVIFVWVPPQNRLTVSSWQIPNQQDYSDASNKLSSLGVHTDQSVELMLLGELDELRRNGIDSLPVLLAINNSKEVFRGGADNSLDKVYFTEQNSLNQFLELWQHDTNDELKASKRSNTKCPAECYIKKHSKVNLQEADRATMELNARSRQNNRRQVCTCTYVDEPIYVQPVETVQPVQHVQKCNHAQETYQKPKLCPKKKKSFWKIPPQEPTNWCPSRCSVR